ncbi:MAG: alkaline phosphatase [Ignavibacteria bacterium]|nr:alkaline phosphatase [Ignavibacteria bacterium]
MKKFFFFLLVLVEINAYSGQPPKNIVILIGDGMGVNYVSASVLSIKNDPFRRFTVSGFSVTCSADKLVTESAAGATAFATGYRTNNLLISIHPETKEPMLTLFELAEKLNKATGIVVTCSITHATPAAFVAHVEHRNMELEIAKQFINLDLDVVIGGGKKFLTPQSLGGDRVDELNLISKIINNGYNYYDSYEKLKNNKPGNKFFALFEPVGLPKASGRDYSLGDLTKIALDYLSKQPNGFILMIEGSQIDWGGHANNQDYLLSEMEDFNTAINTVLDFAEKNGETLVLVTADHETGGMNITDGDVDGCDIELKFSTKGHTADMVPIFTKGPGEEEFSGVMDNYIIGRKLFKLLDSSYQF